MTTAQMNDPERDGGTAVGIPVDRTVRLRELLTDVLRAEAYDSDLHEDEQGDIVVCAMRHDMSLYELGRVSGSLVCQDPEAAHYAIARIKFAARAPLLAQRPNAELTCRPGLPGLSGRTTG